MPTRSGAASARRRKPEARIPRGLHTLSSGVQLAVQQIGEGPDLIFLHGLGANRAFWFGPTVLTLARSFRITLLDLRGHGYSSMPTGGYRPQDLSDDLTELCDILKIRKAVLIGHSYGGQVALQFAVDHPKRVWGLAIFDTRVNCLQKTLPVGDQERLTPLERRLMRHLDKSVDWAKEHDIGVRMLEEVARQPDVMEEVLRDAEEYVPFINGRGARRAAVRWIKLLDETTARSDFRSLSPDEDQLAKITVPVLLSYGERSRCVPSMHRLEELLPNVQHAGIVEAAGHFFPANRPRLVLSLLQPFLEPLQRRQRRITKR